MGILSPSLSSVPLQTPELQTNNAAAEEPCSSFICLVTQGESQTLLLIAFLNEELLTFANMAIRFVFLIPGPYYHCMAIQY